jgi:hypothetical protein
MNMTMEALEDFFAVMPDLRIISRTSTLAYEGSGKRLSVIAAELQTDYVIEGFCRGDASSLLIEGRLIRSKTDEVVAVKSITVSPLRDDPADAARHIGEAFIKYLCTAAPLRTRSAGMTMNGMTMRSSQLSAASSNCRLNIF